METTTPRWITEKEVSKMTSRAAQTVRNDRCRGLGIPYSKIGASIRYRLDDVIHFMETRKITPAEQ